MARFLTALLLASALLAVVQLSRAATPSIAEEFWRTALPDYELPDAVLWNLQPDNTSSKSTTEGTVSDSSQAERLSRLWFFYCRFLYAGGRANSKGSAHHHNHSSGHSHMPAADDDDIIAKVNHTAVFFHEEAVQVGGSLPFHFRPARRAPLGMLPRDAADSIPFSTSTLPGVLALLGIAAGTARAADMEETLSMCEAPPLAGEPKFCATSLEALVEASMATLGTGDIRPVTSNVPRSGAPWQPYTIRAVRPVVVGEGSRFVACHEVAYQYTVYICHDTGLARLYMVDMEGNRGSVVTVAVICHIDTSQWNPEHLPFKLLGTKPGGPPVCHTMPYGHIIWAKNDGGHSSA